MNAIILIIVLLTKEPIDGDYCTFTEDIGTNPKSTKFRIGDKVRITKYKNTFSKGYTKNWSR